MEYIWSFMTFFLFYFETFTIIANLHKLFLLLIFGRYGFLETNFFICVFYLVSFRLYSIWFQFFLNELKFLNILGGFKVYSASEARRVGFVSLCNNNQANQIWIQKPFTHKYSPWGKFIICLWFIYLFCVLVLILWKFHLLLGS